MRTGRRVLIGDGLGVLVALDDRHAVQRARAARVHEVLATGCAKVVDVGEVGESNVTVGRAHWSAAEGGVAVVVVPGAEALLLPLVRVRAGGGDDDVLSVAVRRGRGVAEVRGGIDRLDAELMASGLRG